MLLIVTNRWDQSAHALAARLKHHDARVMTPRDLSRKGWSQRLGQPERCTAVVEGRVVPQADITCVLPLLPCVFEQELTHIVEADRAYVVSEMNAFLTFWLTSLRCPVVNRPSPGCLNGPAWHPAKWSQMAAQAGWAVPPFRIDTPPASKTLSNLTVIGNRCVGKGSKKACVNASRLAALAGVDILTVRLARGRFVSADLAPDLTDSDVLHTVFEMLEEKLRSTNA